MTSIGAIFTFIFIQNVMLTRMIGVPDSGDSPDSGFSFPGLCLLFAVSLVSSLAGWGITALTDGLRIPYLFLPVFCAAFLLLISLLELLAKNVKRDISSALATEIRRVEASGIAFGIGILASQSYLTPLNSALASLAAVGGYACANAVFKKIMERLSLSHVPEAFKGTPIMLLNMALVSMAFMSFDQAFMRNLIG